MRVMVTVDLKLKMHPEMLRACQDMAREADVTPGQIVRDLLAREISKRRRSRPQIRAEETLLAPLRARLTRDLAMASGWDDLDQRLAAKGFEFRAAGAGLALFESPSGARVCKASELGYSHSRLAQRFGKPFPGLKHTWAAQRVQAQLGGNAAQSLIESDP